MNWLKASRLATSTISTYWPDSPDARGSAAVTASSAQADVPRRQAPPTHHPARAERRHTHPWMPFRPRPIARPYAQLRHPHSEPVTRQHTYKAGLAPPLVPDRPFVACCPLASPMLWFCCWVLGPPPHLCDVLVEGGGPPSLETQQQSLNRHPCRAGSRPDQPAPSRTDTQTDTRNRHPRPANLHEPADARISSSE